MNVTVDGAAHGDDLVQGKAEENGELGQQVYGIEQAANPFPGTMYKGDSLFRQIFSELLLVCKSNPFIYRTLHLRHILFYSATPHKRVPACFFQVSVTVDTALGSTAYYFEHHLCTGCRFSTFGRMRFVQVPVVQFLKLRAGQLYRCCFW